MTHKEILEKRGQVVAEMRTFHSEIDGEMTPEQEARWNKYNDEVNALGKQAERAKSLDELESDHEERYSVAEEILRKSNLNGKEEARKGDEPVESRDLAVRGWMKAQAGRAITEQESRAASQHKIDLAAREIQVPIESRAPGSLEDIEKRALSALQGSAGAFSFSSDFVTSIEKALLAFGGIRQFADIIRTSRGNDINWPTIDDTSNTGSASYENEAVTETDITLGLQTWHAYKYSSDMIKVPSELFEDTEIPLESIIGDMLGERLARKTATDFTTGDGNGKPYGVVTRSVLGKTAASSTAVTMDEILDLIDSIDPAYRGMSRFMMHSTIATAIRKLKDGQGQYLWQASLTAGTPDVLAGYSVGYNLDMASTLATGNKIILFGDYSKYKIRDVNTIRLKRLVERFADNDQEAFLAFSRHDGDLLNAGTNPVKHLALA